MKSKYKYNVAMKRYGSVLKEMAVLVEHDLTCLVRPRDLTDGMPEAYFTAVLIEGLTDYYHPTFYKQANSDDRLLMARDRKLLRRLLFDRFKPDFPGFEILEPLLLRIVRLMGLHIQSFGSSKRRLAIVDASLSTNVDDDRGHHPYYPDVSEFVDVTRLDFNEIGFKVLRDINAYRAEYNLSSVTPQMVEEEKKTFYTQVATGSYINEDTLSFTPMMDTFFAIAIRKKINFKKLSKQKKQKKQEDDLSWL